MFFSDTKLSENFIPSIRKSDNYTKLATIYSWLLKQAYLPLFT